MAFDKIFVDRVRESADIIDVVGRSVQLKKTGSEYSACCPFHDEKSPSFTVSAQKQFYHCFGCGAHGNAITFLMEYQGMNFPDAVKQLAGQAGIPIPEETQPTADVLARRAHEASLLAILKKACSVFEGNLPSTPHAIKYLKGRALTGRSAKQFAIGYADKGIASHFADVPTELLVEAGLLVIRENSGEVIDKFRRRIMFPIHNEQGVVIGFGGRTLGNDQPKYLNSPESVVFHKGSELYGLHLAKPEIRKTRTAVVLEGYTDVIMMHQHGETRAVAGLGTSVTETQIMRLFRMADVIVFCFDADKAGRAAADRAARMVAELMLDGKSAQFLTLPGAEDPDSYVQKFGIGGWHELLATAAAPLSTKLTGMLTGRDMDLPEVRAAVAVDAIELLGAIKKAPMFRSAMKTHFEGVLGFALPVKDSIEIKAEPAASARPVETTPRSVLPAPVSANYSEPEQQSPFDRDEADIGIAPGPDDMSEYVAGHTPAPLPNKSFDSFYKTFALYLALGGSDIDQFPAQFMDPFAGVIAAWFADAPANSGELDSKVKSTQQADLRVIVREAVMRMRERIEIGGANGLKQEQKALIVAALRDVERIEQAKRAAAIFD